MIWKPHTFCIYCIHVHFLPKSASKIIIYTRCVEWWNSPLWTVQYWRMKHWPDHCVESLLYACVVYYCSVYCTACNSDVAVRECGQHDMDRKFFPYIFFIPPKISITINIYCTHYFYHFYLIIQKLL